MDFLMTVVSYILPFLVVLSVVVFVHEYGHFIVGRWCGIKVDAFSLGFGPELCAFDDRKGTRWRIAAIPLGGYVKFHGDANARQRRRPVVADADVRSRALRDLLRATRLEARRDRFRRPSVQFPARHRDFRRAYTPISGSP